jgi:leucyl-tRNA synthetase
MTQKYNPKDFEEKWRKKWEEENIHKTPALKANEGKFYSLYSFPYPSGAGLHVGHVEGMVANDIVARFHRMKGDAVTLPMGWDSFGLPAENYAIKTGVHPHDSTEAAVKTFIDQIKKVGISVDWEKEVGAHRPSYYRWTQWIFLQLYKAGLAYQKFAPVNWCPNCQTALANEQVVNGRCERCDTEVVQKEMNQWFFKITDFADRLDKDLDNVDWPESTKSQQRNWIGKKEGININYKIDGFNQYVTCFTTRPDTNFGATFVVLAPDGEALKNIIDIAPNKKEIIAYQSETAKKTELERQQEGRKKTGVFTGLYAINNLNGKEMPIYVSDFVLANFGTGAVVGVPGHDLRDFEFAKAMGIKIIRVVVGKDGDTSEITDAKQVQEEDGTMINSEFLDGLNIHDATKKIMDFIEEKGWGKKVVTYRLRDWLVSRQRYWGAPIPMLRRELDEEENALNASYQSSPDLVIDIHAWGSNSKKHYHDWLHKKLEQNGIEINALDLPNSEKPDLYEWIKAIEAESTDISPNTVITARSLGCWAALKLAEKYKIRKLVLAAPTAPIFEQYKAWSDNADAETVEILKKFVGAETNGNIDFEKVKNNVGEIQVYFSTNDPYINLEKTKDYLKEKLGLVYFTEFKNALHFSDEAGFTKFSELYEEILKPVNLGIKPIPEEDLPVILPYNVNFKPTGESPLKYSEEFHHGIEEKYGKGWRRETDTLDTFICSSWYYFRFLAPENDQWFTDPETVNSWLPVDLYMIGTEHIVLHLLYSRFFTKFFFDKNYIKFDEPFYKMRHMGTILGPDGRKMSKRWGNVINPSDEVETFGADALRLYEMFMGPLEEAKAWNTSGEQGIFRFLGKVWNLQEKVIETRFIASTQMASVQAQEKEINKLIKKVGEDIESLSFNTAIAKMMEFVNFVGREQNISRVVWEKFLLILAPFAPYIAEELWSNLGNEFSIHHQKWPEVDESKIVEETIKLAVQVNGKVRATIEVPFDSEEGIVVSEALKVENVKKYIAGEPKKVIYVKNKILNLIA